MSDYVVQHAVLLRSGATGSISILGVAGAFITTATQSPVKF